MQYSILYEDGTILVCFKEAGLAVESSRLGQKDLTGMLKVRIREMEELSGRGSVLPYLGLVHRLDQPVQGLVVFAKTPEAAADLSKQFAGRGVEKFYRAVVMVPEPGRVQVQEDRIGIRDYGKEALTGRVSCDDPAACLARGRMEDFLLRDGRTNRSAVVPAGTANAKKAGLSWRMLEADLQDGRLVRALLQIRLETGRHHQIRVQLAHGGMPILGDRKYAPAAVEEGPVHGSGTLQADAAGREMGAAPEGAERSFPALCAYSLAFRHPVTGKQMRFALPEKDYCLERFV